MKPLGGPLLSNENIALPLVAELRRLGHDVLTAPYAGRANASVRDADVLAFVIAERRILSSHNRRHFLQLHRNRTVDHNGMLLCASTPASLGSRDVARCETRQNTVLARIGQS